MAENGGGDVSRPGLMRVQDLPTGYRFNPTDKELIVYYLQVKIANGVLPINSMHDVNIYKHNPEYLARKYTQYVRGEGWYFFTSRDKKYRNGSRPSRSTHDGYGYWKAIGAEKVISDEGGNPVGSKQTLDYHLGNPPKGDKTKWKMHEYRIRTELDQPRATPDADNNMKLDDWVLCRIYKGEGRARRESPDTTTNDSAELDTKHVEVEDNIPSTDNPSVIPVIGQVEVEDNMPSTDNPSVLPVIGQEQVLAENTNDDYDDIDTFMDLETWIGNIGETSNFSETFLDKVLRGPSENQND